MEHLLALGKRLFGRTPRIKKTIRYLLGGIIARYDAVQAKKYQAWLAHSMLSNEQLQAQSQHAQEFAYRPLISIIVPTYETPEMYFRQMVESVLSQTYDNWELVLVDDASPNQAVRDLIQEYAKKEPRITSKFLPGNLHIAGATNEAVKMAAGEFISLFDHDDLLWPNALYEVTALLNEHEADLIYTDEDKIAGDTNRPLQPLFKPDWNLDFLRSVNYITHFTTIRKSVLDTYGYENGDYNGAQDWELFLRLFRSIPADRIFHIPKVLYSWRVHAASTANLIEVKPYVAAAQRKAIESDLEARGNQSYELVQDELYPAQWSVRFKPTDKASVLVILQAAADTEYIRKHIRAHTSYENYEISSLGSGKVPEQISKYDYAVVIDQAIEIRSPKWIEDMLGDASRDDIGLVLAECSENDVLRNLSGILGTEIVDFMSRINRRFGTKHLYVTARYNINAAYGGLAMMETKKLSKVLDEGPLDVLKISQLMLAGGYRNLYNPYVKVLK